MHAVSIDFTRPAGPIKPLHGINNSPVTLGQELPELRAAGIPFVRLHDTAGPFGGTCFVDVPNVFPRFDADPDDPAAYDFAFTDAHLKGLAASGTRIFYRLGVTIENSHWIKPCRIHPPADAHRWARICAGIVRHYNLGWADGFRHGIEYWEIWNEPENPPMWTGTPGQYFELYRVTANHLKRQFPEIKVGGYGGSGFYAVTRDKVDALQATFIPYFRDFLAHITAPATAAPLDFFSWHLYTTDPGEIVRHGDFVAATLREHGLAGAESILGEWNFLDWSVCDYDAMKEMPGATFVAAAFCLMQDAPIDKAMYYDALPTREYCGLYYFPSLRVTPTYWAFRAFNELHRLGTAVGSRCAGQEGLHACAARGEAGDGAVLLVNRNMTALAVDLQVKGMASRPACAILDKERLLVEVGDLDGPSVCLPPQSVVLLRYPGNG